MKKLFSLLAITFVAISLVGCKGNTPTDPNPDPDDKEVTYDLGGQDFIIISNSPRTQDPRLETYEGLYQEDKQAAIQAVEEKYKINVVYQSYPSQASWGDARDNWIINNVVSGSPAGHVYEISSVSVPTLAKAGAIQPLNDFIEKYGNDKFFEEKKKFGEFLGEHYIYDDKYPLNNDGIYYNQDLLDDLGYEKNLPTKLWAEGKWNWEEFEKLVKELNEKLDETQEYYPMGGRTYNWAYQFIAANGGHMIDSNLDVGLTNQESLDALQFLADLYEVPGMWIDQSSYDNAVEQQFVDGKVIFHPGQYWYCIFDSKFARKTFDNIGFVPFPTGPNTNEDLSNYGNVTVWGPGSYVISAGYEKDKIPAGYEHMFINNELLFQIWNEMQYFGTAEDFKGDFGVELYKYYADEESINAHLDVVDAYYNDLFYAFGSDSHSGYNDSFMKAMENAIRENNIRTQIEAVVPVMEQKIEEKFGDLIE